MYQQSGGGGGGAKCEEWGRCTVTLNKLEVRRRAQPDPDARVCMYNLLFLVFFEKRKKEIQFSFKEFQQEKNEVQSKFIIIPRHRNRG